MINWLILSLITYPWLSGHSTYVRMNGCQRAKLLPLKIATPMEVVTISLQQATESLRRAEERLYTYMDNPTNQPLNINHPIYVELKAEVTACTAVLTGAQRNYDNTLAAQNRASLIQEQKITLHQYLQTIPPLPTYSHILPGPSSTIPRNVRHPQLTLHWESFQRDTLNYIQTEVSQLTNLMDKPAFPFHLSINNEVPALQMCVALNLFDVVSRRRDSTVWTSSGEEIVGNPDGYIVKNDLQSISFMYEIKGKWTLNPEWFQNGRIDMFVGEDLILGGGHNCLRNSVNQIYTYMVWNHLQFGILSSFDFTFFLKRVKVEDSSDGCEQLLISTGIAHNATNPTVLQSIAYFLSLADGIPFTSANEYISRPTLRQTANFVSGDGHGSVPIQKDTDLSYESDFALEDFHIKSVLGRGRTKVYYDAKNHLALKSIDLWNQSYMLDELHNEIEIYRLLSDLQGICIPKLVLHGYWEGGMYCIGFSLCGTVPKTLSESQKQSLMSSIDAIHDRGILHNDIKKENILVDENGKVYLIDFGFATLNSCEDAQQAERNQMLNCIKFL